MNIKSRSLSVGSWIKLGTVAVIAISFATSHLASRVSSEPRYIAPQARLENPIQSSQTVVIDEVVAAEVAAAVAQETDLSITSNVTDRAVTLDAQATMIAQTDEGTTTPQLEKPQIVAPNNQSTQAILTITTVTGDSVSSLAQKYGISEETIRWANSLVVDTLQPGIKLTILPVSGVLYTVAQGDTAESIAQTYKSTAEAIKAFNDVEVKGLKPGAQIIIPNGVKPSATTTYRPTQSSSSIYPFGGASAIFAGNRYAYGYCTWYAYNKRASIGRPVASNWGNATTWASLAASSGFTVDKTPRAGAVFQTSGGWGGYGHVGFVEKVNPNGSIVVSEMNYAGWNVISSRTISASEIALYSFIH